MDPAWLFPIGVVVLLWMSWIAVKNNEKARSGWDVFAERNGFTV